MPVTKNAVEPITRQELEELAHCKELQEHYGFNSAHEMRDELIDGYVAKFPSYITDGPGYSGALFVIVTGTLDAILVTRENGTLSVWNKY